jgi:REP-associated tyrosine transposase
MVKRRVYDDQNHIHFVTFSCYKRRKFLNTDRARRIVIGHLGSRLSNQNGLCLGFVIMPDHVHALVWFPEIQQISKFMNKWKDQTSYQLKELFKYEYPKYWSQIDDSDPIWQARYYGLNIWSRKKIEEKLDYMHLNPVRAGLVEQTCDWLWSSARWYQEKRSVGLNICWPPGIEDDDDFNTL